jgi:hypothetical protein
MLAPAFTHERAGRILAGLSFLAVLALGWWASPWFLLGGVGVALNLILSGITDRCAVKSLLVKVGLPGERDVGHAEARASRQSEALSEAAPAGTWRAGQRASMARDMGVRN